MKAAKWKDAKIKGIGVSAALATVLFFGLLNGGHGLLETHASNYELQWNLVENEYGNLVSSGGKTAPDYVGNYSCYDYALEDVFEVYDPDNYWRQPGQISVETYAETWQTVEDIVERVSTDLFAAGFDVSYSTKRPTALAAGESLICTRVGHGDFHFMKWSQMCGVWGWTQKFRMSIPMMYLLDPEAMDWGAEGSWAGDEFLIGQSIYDSDVYYITYGETPFLYSICNGKCIIEGIRQGYNYGPSELVYIPENINGMTVSAVAEEAFSGRTDIYKVSIPVTVTEIGDEAFYGCQNLSSVFIAPGDSAVSLGDDVFVNCSSSLEILLDSAQEYRKKADWNAMTGSIAEYAVNGNALYNVAYTWTNYSGQDWAEWVTMYNYDDYDGYWDPQYYDSQSLIVGYFLRNYFAYCHLVDWSYFGTLQMRLLLQLDSLYEGREILLLDGDGVYVTSAQVIQGVANFDMSPLIESEDDYLCLFPADQNGYAIEFEAEDVLFQCYNSVIDSSLCLDDYFNLTWYQNYLS